MWHLAYRASAFPGDYAVTVRVMAAHPALRVDFNDTAPTHTDPDGSRWCVVPLRDGEATPALVARHGALAARVPALAAMVAALPDPERFPRTPEGLTDWPALSARVEAVVADMEVRQDGPDGTPFADRADLDAVLAEQGPQDALLCLASVPDDWARPDAEADTPHP